VLKAALMKHIDPGDPEGLVGQKHVQITLTRVLHGGSGGPIRPDVYGQIVHLAATTLTNSDQTGSIT
jgi:hypothetical protein